MLVQLSTYKRYTITRQKLSQVACIQSRSELVGMICSVDNLQTFHDRTQVRLYDKVNNKLLLGEDYWYHKGDF